MAPRAQQGTAMVYWQYGLPPTPLDLVRNGPLSRSVRLAVHVLLRAYLGLFHCYRVRGGRQLKRLRGHLIVANHSSHLDALAVLSAFPLRKVNRVRSLCAKDYFFAHPLRATISFLLANTIPMDRGRYDAKAVAYCREELAAGKNIIFFPEGTRSPEGRLGPFKPGVGLIAMRYGLPVLPLLIRGCYECCPKGALLPRPGRIEVLFDRPVRYRLLRSRKRDWKALACDLRRRVARLAVEGGKDQTHHESPANRTDEDARSFGRATQRRRAHRLPRRLHLRQDGGLRLPQQALGQAVDR